MDRLPARAAIHQERGRIDRERLAYILSNTLDWELWRETRHMLPARVYKAVKRGEVRQLSPIVEYLPGLVEVYVQRLKPRPPWWRRPLIIAGVALAVMGLVLWACYVVFHVLAVALAPALVILSVAWLIFHYSSDHGAKCRGLHCPGCRG